MLFMGWGPPRLDVSREGGYWDNDSEPNEIDSEMDSASVSHTADAQEDSGPREMRNIASVSQPSVRVAASAAAQEDSEMKNTDNASEPDWGDVSEPSLPDTASVSQPSARVAASAAAQEDSGMKNIASVSQPSVRDTASAAPATNVGKTDGPAHGPVDFNAMD